MIKLPVFAKLLVPGYRTKWQRKCAAMIDHINKIASSFEYGKNDDVPWIESNNYGMRFHGFWTESGKGEVYDIIQPYLSHSISKHRFPDCEENLSTGLRVRSFAHFSNSPSERSLPCEPFFVFLFRRSSSGF